MNKAPLTRNITKLFIINLLVIAFFTILLSFFTLTIHNRMVWNNYSLLFPYIIIGIFIGLIISFYQNGKLSSNAISLFAKFTIPIWLGVAALVFIFSSMINKDLGYSYQLKPISVYSFLSEKKDLEFNSSTYSFKESQLSNNKRASYLVFYRFDCSLCKIGMPYLLNHLTVQLKNGDAKNGIQFIDVSTSQGSKIARQYGVKRAGMIAEFNDKQRNPLIRSIVKYNKDHSKIIIDKPYLDNVISNLSK